MRKPTARVAARLRSQAPDGGPRPSSLPGGIAVFVLVAALVYVAGRALLGAWPMWSAMRNGGMMGDGMMGGSGLFAPLLMLMFWGGVLALLAWLVVSIFSSLFSSAHRDDAEATLRERFARGEISAEEYQHALRTLRAEKRHGEIQHEDRESIVRSGRE